MTPPPCDCRRLLLVPPCSRTCTRHARRSRGAAPPIQGPALAYQNREKEHHRQMRSSSTLLQRRKGREVSFSGVDAHVTIFMFIQCNYKIATMWFSKTVPYDRLRTRDVNNNYKGNNYKNVTALFSKAVL